MSTEISIINFLQWERDGSSDLIIKCPTCGYFCTHFRGSRPSQSQQAGIVLTFEGECGHYFELTFGGHKGTVFVETADITAEVNQASDFLITRGVTTEEILERGFAAAVGGKK